MRIQIASENLTQYLHTVLKTKEIYWQQYQVNLSNTPISLCTL